MKACIRILPVILWSLNAFSQGGYVFRTVTLPQITLNTPARPLHYPAWTPDVSITGMGRVQTAGGEGAGMLSNPAVLARKQTRFEVPGFLTAFPGATWDAAWFLESHMDDFIDGDAFSQMLDGVEAFLEPGVTLEQRWAALAEVQEGMEFALDLVNRVSGPADDPNRYGFTILPALGAQIGNWGVSLYGYGQANFLVQQSPTLEALTAVDIPQNLDDPGKAARSMLQILGILGAGLIEGSRSFSREVFPVAFYVSYMDLVGALGYGMQLTDFLQAGAGIKMINRRLSLQRIDFENYDRIVENAFSDLSRSVTGVTADLGFRAVLPFGTEVGLSLLNIIPMKKLADVMRMDFMQHGLAYDLAAGQKQVDAAGDTMMIRYKRPVVREMPYELQVPLLVNLGFYHQLTERWSVGLDWLDLLENDMWYRSTLSHLRVGTAYHQPVWAGKLETAVRLGFGDEHLVGGLGLNIYNLVFLDGAYSWDPLVRAYSYYGQLRVVI